VCGAILASRDQSVMAVLCGGGGVMWLHWGCYVAALGVSMDFGWTPIVGAAACTCTGQPSTAMASTALALMLLRHTWSRSGQQWRNIQT
jgi:hypothetical protein